MSDSIINFPPSMNLQKKASALSDMTPLMSSFRSANQTYGAQDTIRINLATGLSGHFLHAADSFISFRFKVTHASTAAVLRLDGTAYSFFRNFRVSHGSNQLVNVKNSNRLWNALFDLQCNSAQRESRQNDLCIDGDTVASRCNNLFGIEVNSDEWYSASFCIPSSVVGSLQEMALPLGWMNQSELTIEFDVDNLTRIFTNRLNNDTILKKA